VRKRIAQQLLDTSTGLMNQGLAIGSGRAPSWHVPGPGFHPQKQQQQQHTHTHTHTHTRYPGTKDLGKSLVSQRVNGE
jgi:hypothetical protein